MVVMYSRPIVLTAAQDFEIEMGVHMQLHKDNEEHVNSYCGQNDEKIIHIHGLEESSRGLTGSND